MSLENPVIVSEIHGVRVDVEVNEGELYEWFRQYLSGFLSDSSSTPKIRFKLSVHSTDPLSVPDDAEWFLHYYGLAGLTHDRRFYFRALDSVFRFDPSSGIVEGSITGKLLAQRRYLTHVFFTVVLFETLRYHGLYYIHGAGLVGPDGKGILIPANASCGKSTLSVALLHHGYNYVSDDALFARYNGEKVELAPFVREFHVSPHLADIFSELEFLKDEPEYFPGNDKRAFRAEEVYPGRFVKVMGAPDVVLFPHIVEDESSSVERLSSQQALTMMIPNSALIMFSLPAAKRHLEALKTIASSARCFRLRSGRDVYEDPVNAVGNILRQLGSTDSKE